MIHENDPRLTDYVLGELDESERTKLERELEHSPALRQEMAAIQEAAKLLGASLQAAPAPGLTDQQRREIQEQATENRVSLAPQPSAPLRQTRWARRVLGAVSLLVLAGLLLMLTLPSVQTAREAAQRTPALEKEMTRELMQRDAGRADGGFLSKPTAADTEHDGETTSRPAAPMSYGAYAADESGARFGEDLMLLEDSSRSFDTGGSGGGVAREESESLAPVEALGMPGMPGGMERDFQGGMLGGMAGAGGAGGYPGRPQGDGGPSDAAWGDNSAGSSDRLGRVDMYADATAGRQVLLPSMVPADPEGFERFSAANDFSPATLPAPALEPEVRQLAEETAVRELADLEKQEALLQRTTELGTRREAEGRSGEPATPSTEAPQRVGRLLNERLKESGEADAGKPVDQNQQSQRTWRRAAATPNASRLMVGDHDELLLEGMQANVLVDGFRARVLLDLYYFNNRGQQLEGNFKLRLPDDASLYYFAFGESAYEYRPQVDQLASKGFLTGDLVRASGLSPRGILEAREGSWSNVKEARVVPRSKAAHAYSETVRRRVDPALVEWSGAGVFNARVFPLMANKLHRIVVGYDLNLQQVGADLVYRLDLPAEAAQCMVDLNVAAWPGASATVEPDARPFTSGGRAYYHFNNVSDRRIELRYHAPEPMMLAGRDPLAEDFFATRIVPDLPAGDMEAGAERAIFLVDTSLSSRPDKFNIWLKQLEATLERNRDSIRQFAVLFFDIESHWWREGFADNTPDNVAELLAYGRSLSLEGATDLLQALSEATAPQWAADNKDTPSATLFLLSDGAATWGDQNVHRLSRTLVAAEAPLFAYKTGLTGSETGLLEHLARESGGAVFSIVSEQEVDAAATAHRHRPWKLLNVTVPGGSDLLLGGRPQYLYPGQPLLIVGRGQPDAEVLLHVRRGDEERHVAVKVERVGDTELAARAYGQVAVGQLEDLGGAVEDVAVAYARHFRVTGQTCSLLMLESEADYARFNVKPEDDVFVVRSTPSAELVAKKLDELAASLADAKAALVAWLAKLENTPGFQFEMPTALRLMIERLPPSALEVASEKLSCKSRGRVGVPKDFAQQLEEGKLDYLAVTERAQQQLAAHGAADGLRTLSSLVEQNPGDPVLSRDVAFSAMEWGLGGQAYPLLQRVARLRPYEPLSYQAMAQCLADVGHADLAMVYYEVAMNGTWHERYRDVNQIAAVEYLRLLRRIERGELSSHAKEYAQARLESLTQQAPVGQADLVVTMMWNTDRTDVDLHVVEPTGEECYYEHPQTRLGGRITRDVTEGLGPEMYMLPQARSGDYKILANYFGSDSNRTQMRTKVYISVYEDFGRPSERLSKRTVTLSDQKEKRELAAVVVEK